MEVVSIILYAYCAFSACLGLVFLCKSRDWAWRDRVGCLLIVLGVWPVIAISEIGILIAALYRLKVNGRKGEV